MAEVDVFFLACPGFVPHSFYTINSYNRDRNFGALGCFGKKLRQSLAFDYISNHTNYLPPDKYKKQISDLYEDKKLIIILLDDLISITSVLFGLKLTFLEGRRSQ